MKNKKYKVGEHVWIDIGFYCGPAIIEKEDVDEKWLFGYNVKIMGAMKDNIWISRKEIKGLNNDNA